MEESLTAHVPFAVAETLGARTQNYERPQAGGMSDKAVGSWRYSFDDEEVVNEMPVFSGFVFDHFSNCLNIVKPKVFL